MEYLIANVEHFKFDIEIALEEQYGALPLPFPGMDSMYSAVCTISTDSVITTTVFFVESTSAVCQFYTSQFGCAKGNNCPFRHVKGDRTIVCKHWLRGLCKKGTAEHNT